MINNITSKSSMINCTCMSQDIKNAVQQSNLVDSIKKQIEAIHTCGFISDENISEIIKELVTKQGQKTIALKPVINSMLDKGLSKKEIDARLLDLRKHDKIYLEVGTPIGATEEELAETTIATKRARFAYIKLKQ